MWWQRVISIACSRVGTFPSKRRVGILSSIVLPVSVWSICMFPCFPGILPALHMVFWDRLCELWLNCRRERIQRMKNSGGKKISQPPFFDRSYNGRVFLDIPLWIVDDQNSLCEIFFVLLHEPFTTSHDASVNKRCARQQMKSILYLIKLGKCRNRDAVRPLGVLVEAFLTPLYFSLQQARKFSFNLLPATWGPTDFQSRGPIHGVMREISIIKKIKNTCDLNTPDSKITTGNPDKQSGSDTKEEDRIGGGCEKK